MTTWQIVLITLGLFLLSLVGLVGMMFGIVGAVFDGLFIAVARTQSAPPEPTLSGAPPAGTADSTPAAPPSDPL